MLRTIEVPDRKFFEKWGLMGSQGGPKKLISTDHNILYNISSNLKQLFKSYPGLDIHTNKHTSKKVTNNSTLFWRGFTQGVRVICWWFSTRALLLCCQISNSWGYFFLVGIWTHTTRVTEQGLDHKASASDRFMCRREKVPALNLSWFLMNIMDLANILNSLVTEIWWV